MTNKPDTLPEGRGGAGASVPDRAGGPSDPSRDASRPVGARPSRMAFNVNHWVWVRLTDHGRTMLDAKMQKYRDMFPDTSFPMPAADADGFSRWQLWQLMEDLGEYCVMGRPQPFETTILLDASKLHGAVPCDSDGNPKGGDGTAPSQSDDSSGPKDIAPPQPQSLLNQEKPK